MKHLSITAKITIWFAIFMVVLSALMLVFVWLLSSAASSGANRDALVRFVEENADEVEYDDGELDIDDDFVSYRSGMYCLVYRADGVLVSGYAPYDELISEALVDGIVRTVNAGGESYLIYDRVVRDDEDPDIWVRGVVPENAAAISRTAITRAALIAIPLLIVLAVVGGYLTARRSLRPIQQINQTAEEIGRSGDLTKRIDMGPGNDELHQLATTFNQMFDRLEENFEAERRFTADASHELRTPVTIILSQCEYAFENAEGEEALYQSLEAIQKQGYRIKRIIESLLQFTRMEQRTEDIPMGPVDFSGLVQSVCQEQGELNDRNITLTAEVLPGIHLTGNTTLLTRLVENLLRNAFKYGRDGGWVQVRLWRTEREVVLQVTDNGIGIPAEELPKIWTRFYQVDKARISGLGLGLAMVKQIASLHGGSVFAESQEHIGSTFTVRFPRTD